MQAVPPAGSVTSVLRLGRWVSIAQQARFILP